MLKTILDTCHLPSMRHANIVGLGVPNYQVQVWSELIGIGGAVGKMPKSKWRTYSPADVFQISIMRLLKSDLNFAFSKREKWIKMLSSPSTLTRSLESFYYGKDAFIISDFNTTFDIATDPDAIQFEIVKSNLSLIIPTAFHVEAMLQATAASTDERQQFAALSLLARHQKSSSKSNNNRTSHQRAPSSRGLQLE